MFQRHDKTHHHILDSINFSSNPLVLVNKYTNGQKWLKIRC